MKARSERKIGQIVSGKFEIDEMSFSYKRDSTVM